MLVTKNEKTKEYNFIKKILYSPFSTKTHQDKKTAFLLNETPFIKFLRRRNWPVSFDWNRNIIMHTEEKQQIMKIFIFFFAQEKAKKNEDNTASSANINVSLKIIEL